jgi:hypothetical protein
MQQGISSSPSMVVWTETDKVGVLSLPFQGSIRIHRFPTTNRFQGLNGGIADTICTTIGFGVEAR